MGGGREEGGADADGEDGGGGGLAVGGEVHAGDEADAGGVDGDDGLGEDAVGLEHGGEREGGGDEEEGERGGGDTADGVVAAVTRAGDEGALDEGEGECRVADLEDGAPGGRDGDEGEVQRQEFCVIADFVVGDGLGQRIVPDGVVCERRAAVCGEGDPEPAGERGGEGERGDAEHDVELGLRGELEAEACGGVGAHGVEVDDDDRRGPVELGEVRMGKVHGVVYDG